MQQAYPTTHCIENASVMAQKRRRVWINDISQGQCQCQSWIYIAQSWSIFTALCVLSGNAEISSTSEIVWNGHYWAPGHRDCPDRQTYDREGPTTDSTDWLLSRGDVVLSGDVIDPCAAAAPKFFSGSAESQPNFLKFVSQPNIFLALLGSHRNHSNFVQMKFKLTTYIDDILQYMSSATAGNVWDWCAAIDQVPGGLVVWV